MTSAKDSRLALLKNCDFFSSLKEEELKRILSVSSSFVAEAGREIFQESESCQGLHFLVTGRVKLSKVSVEGKEQVLRDVPPGQAFGGAAFFSRQGRFPATAVALERCSILLVPKPPLMALLLERPRMTLAMLDTIATHQMEMMNLAQGLSLERVEVRLAKHLLLLARAAGGPKPGQVLDLGCNQSELAARLGTVREVVSRSLRSLKGQGAIALKGRQVTLLDLKALQAI